MAWIPTVKGVLDTVRAQTPSGSPPFTPRIFTPGQPLTPGVKPVTPTIVTPGQPMTPGVKPSTPASPPPRPGFGQAIRTAINAARTAPRAAPGRGRGLGPAVRTAVRAARGTLRPSSAGGFRPPATRI